MEDCCTKQDLHTLNLNPEMTNIKMANFLAPQLVIAVGQINSEWTMNVQVME